MSTICSLCSGIPFLDLPPFPPWLKSYHVPIGPTSDLVPFLPSAEALTDGEENVDDSRKLKPGILPGFPHHRTLDALTLSASTCELCKFIHDSVLAVKGIWDEAKEDASQSYYDRSGPPTYQLYVTARREHENGFLVWSVSERNNEVFLLVGIGYCVDEDSPLKTRFRGRPISTDPRSPLNIDRYRSWLIQCDQDHQKCSRSVDRPATPTWPLRLLDIGSANASSTSIKLVESPPLGVKYATLSHCWGDSLHFVLTHATLHAYKQTINVSELPKTYQDAIFIARELNVPYIWIDSLCICQDDGSDWERESAKMASIYSNAYVSIASSSASSDATGFLNPQPQRKYINIPITVPSADDEGPSLGGDLRLFSISPHLVANGSHYIAMKHLPLPTRAWALQERYLSPRSLLFGDSQTFFECATCFVSEDGFYSPHTWFNFTEKETAKPRKGNTEQGPEYRHRMGSKWYHTLYQYSDRKLSRDSDKLPALSGMARAFEDMMGGEYVAGLWKADLIEGLTFQCFGGEHSRPREWRAPSWSWASVDGMLSVTDIGGWDDLLEVKDVKVEVKGENPYGEVQSGELRLACTLEKLRVSEKPEHYAGKVPHRRNVRLCFEDGDPYGHHVSFDVKDATEGTHGLELFGIPLAASSSGTAYVLIVVPDKSSGRKAFRREGYCFAKLMQRWKEAKNKGDLVDVVLI